MANFRELKNGVTVYELEKPVELIVKTKAPMKWKLVDRETGEEYIGCTPKDGEYHWSKIEGSDD
jgi:hypothetical protein